MYKDFTHSIETLSEQKDVYDEDFFTKKPDMTGIQKMVDEDSEKSLSARRC